MPTESKMPDLDEAVLAALHFLSSAKLPKIQLGKYRNLIVIGSGNAAVTGRVLFDGKEAVFANEGDYLGKIEKMGRGDLCVIVSASGGKHAPMIAKDARKQGLRVLLITNNRGALADEYANESVVFDKIEEPYTYNVSTYLGMILSKTGEKPEKITDYLGSLKKKMPSNLEKYDSYFFIIPERFEMLKEMLITKFDELFGSRISVRVYTLEQTKHAKTVVPNGKELFLGLGCKNELFGEKRLNIEMPRDAGPAFFIAAAYFIIGQIQKQNEPYFKENIERYAAESSKVFGQRIDAKVR